MSASVNGSGGGATVNGSSGGSSLPTTPAAALLDAANAGEVVLLAPSTGVGTSAPLGTTVSMGVGEATQSAANGDFLVGDGSGSSQLASAAASAVRGVIGAGAGVATYYADSFTAQAGSESASITGTGTGASATLTATSTSRTYGSGGMTAARIVLSIPAGVKMVDVAVQVTAISGVTAGWRYITVAMRDSATGSNPTTLYGFGHGDGSSCYYGNLLTGANGGLGPVTTGNSIAAADRWIRCTFDTAPSMLALLSGIGSAGARPTTWSAPTTAIPLVTSGSTPGFGGVPDTTTATALVIVLQSFGTGGATSLTIKPIVRVWM